MNTFIPHCLLTLALAGLAAPTVAADKAVPSLNIQVAKSTLLDVTLTGTSLVGVGERGVIARSDDGGHTWHSQLSPSTRTLTAVAFVDNKIGVAVGHGGTLLRTEDGGITWVSILVKEIGRDALLGVTALRNTQFVAFGAFGMYLVSTDLGKSWQRQRILGDDFERHISRVIEARDALFLVGETGVMARSKDGGKVWTALKSPYEGSFFGLLELKSGALLAFGMRGNVFRSTDQGHTWEKQAFASQSTLNGGSVGADGRVVLAGNRGLLATSSDDGRHFVITSAPQGSAIAQARWLADGGLVYVGAMATGHLSPQSLSKAAAAAAPAP